MALTKEQIRIMDGITGLNSVQTQNKPSNNNSLSDEDIKRMDEITGLAQYEAPKNENPLRQQIIDDDPIKAKEWEDKGPITPYEAALDASREFNGTYDKVIQRPKAQGSVGLNPLGKAVSEFLDDKLPAIKKAIKSMNEAAKPLAESEIKFQEQQAELSKARQGVNENDKTKRYDITGYDRLGRPIYSETDLLDKIGFIEALGENFAKGTAFGSIAEGVNDAALRKIKDKIVKGETIYQDELDVLNRHYDKEREKIVRGYSKAGVIGQGVGYSLGLLSDFIWGGAAVKALGAGAIGGNVALKSYLGLRNANVGVKAAGAISKTAGIAAEGATLPLIHTVVNPYRTYEEYQGRMLNNEIELTDRGNLIFKESDEKPATAFFKSLGKVYDMYLAEIMGGKILGAATNSIGKGIGYAATPVIENLFKRFPALEPFMKKSLVAFSKKFEELNKMPVLGKSTDWIKNTARFDGFLKECGEEALEDVLNLTLGVDNEDRTLENYARAIFKTPEEWAVIAGTIAIQGAGLSAANYMIAKSMAEKGKSPEEIQETISNISESQSHEIVDELIKNNDIAINELNTPEEEAAEKRQKAVERISRGFQQGNIKDKRLADATGNLVVTMLEKASEVTNAPIEELIEKNAPKFKAVDEVGYAQDNTPLRKVDERLAALETEFNNLSTDETFDVDKFNELEAEYNELMELRNQGQEYYQGANTAGAQEGEKLKAAKEWKEKGTESKYFKKWFGDSKVVDEEGKPLVVYHGSRNTFEVFEHIEGLDSDINSINTKEAFFFVDDNIAADEFAEVQREAQIIRLQAEKHVGSGYNNIAEKQRLDNEIKKQSYNDNIRYNVYLSIQNPITVDFEGKEYNAEDVDDLILKALENGNDGIIIKNIDDAGGVHTQYAVFNPEQIKSVDNQGTFDAENPNIYYQNIFKKIYNAAIDAFTNKSEKLSDLFDEVEALHPLKEYFSEELKDVKFKQMPEWMTNDNKRMGVYSPVSNIIYLNFDKIKSYENKEQQFYRTLLHEVSHAKQFKLVKYAIKNLNNKKLSKEDRAELKEYLDINKLSKKDVSEYNKFLEKYTANKVKNNKELEKKSIELYSKYRSSAMEIDADNVVLALLYRIDKTKNRVLGRYADNVFGLSEKTRNLRRLPEQEEIRAFNKRGRTNHFGLGRLDNIVDTKRYFQAAYHGTPHKFDKFSLENIYNREENKKSLEILKKGIARIESYDVNKIEQKGGSGQLFKVDIPDIDEMLDENKPFKEQSEKVQKAFKKLLNDEYFSYGSDFKEIKKDLQQAIKENTDGKIIYKILSRFDAETAGKTLNKYGIKGITYDGRQDGRCYVIFDDKAVKVLEKYYQFAGEGSETADKYSLKNAKKMLKDGVNPETVRKETGWFKGVDGKFRYEISDNDAVVNIDRVKKARQDEIDYINLNIIDYNNRMSYLVQQHDAKEISDEDFREQYDSLMNRKLEEVDNLRYYENKAYASYLSGILDHEKLYAAYPSLRTIRVEFRPLEFGIMGKYSEKSREIIISQALWVKGKEAELKKTLMHEIQHFIQHQEGFAVGGNQKNIEIILADAKDAINNSKDSKEYDFVMKKYSIVNNLLLIRSIQNKPENITKSYWWMQQGKGWYAPRKTRKKERTKYINDCCQEFIDYSIQKHKDNNTFEGYKKYSKKDTAELKKEARRLNYRASKVLDKLSPDYKNLDKIEHALNQLDRYEVNTFDLYKRLAGETEARNTENRVNLSDKERLEKAPSETADVPSNEQLVVFDDGTEAFSESNDMSDDGNDISDKLQKIKGSYIPTERIIELFKDADESTIVHELAHWYLDLINEYAQYSEELTQDLEKVRAFLKNDGGEFTREQHEKFARAFEAYIRTGYARNNRLKKIFEDFKNWLISIYDDIKKIVYTENGVDKYFTDDEVKTIQNLFDRLLTSEKERIKTTVFDKVQEVEDKINSIKENEKKELQQLDEIYKDNISALNRKSDKKRSVQEYLDLADKMTSRETKEVKEFKKRFKDATLDILSTATGYDKKFIANSRNWEKVQFALENAEDKITISGFNPEWSEFYSSDGVTYENDELGADYNLVSQAFKVLTEGTYNKTFDENYEFEDINKFSAKVDYLAAKVKTLKGDERSAAVEAMFSLFNEMPSMPDEVTQDLFKKVNEVAQYAEDNTREDYNSMTITSVPIIHQLQFYVTQKLNNLKIYNPETRYKMRINKSHRLYRYIKDIKSINSAKKQVRRINEFIIDDMRNNQRSLLHKEIQKQIKVNSKLVKSGTISKGKFDWRTNTVFAELVELNKLKREEAEAQLGAILQIQDAAKGENRDSFDENETAEFNKINNFQQNLKNKFIQYRSMKVQDLDVEHTILLLQDILELKEKGRQAKSEQDFINKTQKWNTRNNLLDILEVTKQSGAKFGANWVAGVGKGVSLNGGTLANWESLLNSIFNKDTAQKYSLLLDEANSDIYARKHILNFYQRAFDIYRFRKPSSWDRFLDYDDMQPIIKLFQDYDNEKYTYVQKVFSINSPEGFARSSIEISKSQMITMFTWSLNDKLEQRLFNQFGIEQIRDMFEDKLSDEDKELAWALIDTCEGMRDDINEVFINTTGLSLPKVENYFPSKAERVQSDLDLYHDNWVKSSSPSFIKERKTCNRIPMKPLSPLEILIPHINKTAKYVVMSEHVNFLNQVFKDTAIKTKMQEIWGSEDGAKIYQTLINKLAACTFTNYSKGANLVAGALDTLSRNYITSAIGFSPKVALGQLLSVVNYAENMPAGVWAKGFIKTLAHPVENFKYMLDNCEYLQTRLAGNSQNEVIAILTSEKDRFRTLRNFMTSNVKWGDIIAITLGGKPYVDYLIEQGMKKEDAFNLFVENTLRAQQAGTTSSISEWQSAQAKNCLTRMFFAFRNTDMQYERKFIDTLIQGKKGEIGKKELIKKVFIYKILNPFMFISFLQNMDLIAFFRGIFAGDDPDETIIGLLKSAVEAFALAGLNAYGHAGFLASSVIETIIALYDKEFKHFEKEVPVLSDFDHQIKKILKDGASFADYVDALAIGSEYALGIPSTKVVNTIEGIGDVTQGNIGVGLSRMAGWGRYTATKAWTGQPPERRKSK